MLASFEQVTSDFGTVISSLNRLYGTNFKEFDHNDESEKEIFKVGGFHLSPSKKRDGFKDLIEKEFENSKYKKKYDQALITYNEVLLLCNDIMV